MKDVTPTPQLRQLWAQEAQRLSPHDPVEWIQYVSDKAAQWGADRELEASCTWMRDNGYWRGANDLHASRRPKPPSLAEEALQALGEADAGLTEMEWPQRSDQIRLALERLQELEAGND